MSETLCLQWNDFKDNVKRAFGNLREDRDFSDVTLACEDGHQMEAHKVILAASSPFFRNLLVKNRHAHPMIYMRGLKSEDLLAIIDFLYCGEANVLQENLDTFLGIAAELKLEGLTDSNEREAEKIERKPSKPKPGDQNFDPITQYSSSLITEERHLSQFSKRKIDGGNMTIAMLDDFPAYMAELDEKVKSMMEKSQNMISYGKGNIRKANVCKICGKEGQIVAIRDHIEANHLEGISLPCNQCEKTCRSRNSLRMHKSLHHN